MVLWGWAFAVIFAGAWLATTLLQSGLVHDWQRNAEEWRNLAREMEQMVHETLNELERTRRSKFLNAIEKENRQN